jgi:WD40 repeat protein
MNDSDSELGELRTDGFNARVLTSVIGAGGGYIPLHKEPPRYIRVKPHNKKTREFNHLFLAQELLGSKRASEDEPRTWEPATAVGSKILKPGDAIWATEFSLDGQYLAVAGKDQTVRVFSVISTPEERRAYEEEEEAHGRGDGERLSAPVFRSKPAREFEGHTGEVLALSWSKNNFLLSSSMDKTVRLWHMSRPECLCTFKHNDLVTSIAFHPTDDRFFLAGSLDAQLRLWSIPDKAVAFSATANEFITAVAFSPDGKTAICGLLSGLCLFYDTEGLELKSQIHVRSSRGKNAKGSKITGIRTAWLPSDNGKQDAKVLISSNDSRVRIYSLRTKMLELKFRGLENQSSQIHARFSDDGIYVISGSEDRRAYIWNLDSTDNDLKDKQPYECFDAHPEVVTTASMAPIKTRQLLSASGDPIFDLCNPPPVTLLSLEERNTSQSKLSEGGLAEGAATTRKTEESPAYIERSKHLDGSIIVTTDRKGTIKVFRQDCAYTKRHQSQWETASKFSGRLTGGMGRSGSIATRTSAGSRVQSRRGSLNLGTAMQQPQLTSDRIMSWRQDVEGRPGASLATSRSERSMSPMKSSHSPLNRSAANIASEARRQPYASSLAGRTNDPTSPRSSIYTRRDSVRAPKDKENGSIPPTPSFSLVSASCSEQNEDKGEGSFWNLSRWKPNIPSLRYSLSASPLTGGSVAATGNSSKNGGDHLKIGHRASGRHSLAAHDIRRLKGEEDANRRRSVGPTAALWPRVSESDSIGGSIEEGTEASDTVTPGKKRTDSGVAVVSADSTDDSDTATCQGCGGRSFKAKRLAKGTTSLSCQKCGKVIES